jgi:hypothetical protein
MEKVRPVDMIFLDELFDMGSGWVLNFSDRTFSQFFASELNIDIDAPQYRTEGTSKAKRLRCFLKNVNPTDVVRTLKALWEYRQAIRASDQLADPVFNAEGRLFSLINRLEGRAGAASPVGPAPVPAFDTSKIESLKAQLLALANLDAQPRGIAFEKFLKELFNLYGMSARDPFRLVGEQIDGSFLLAGETYLLEAKWHSHPIGVADLHTFHGKLDQKAAWTRGLFVSYSGFTEEGLTAFGRGKKAICMDGWDLYETLNRELPLPEVLNRKVRRAGETGQPFWRVVDLFS